MSIEDIPAQPRRNYLLTPRLRVVLEAEPHDIEFFVQTDNRDAIAWDLVRSQKKWPTANEANYFYITTLAWSALKRSGETKSKLDDFFGECVQVEPVDEDGNFKRMSEDDEANPIRPGRDTDF